MSSYCLFVIARPQDGTVVQAGYVGGNRLVEHARNVLRRPPDHAVVGEESWALCPGEAARIAEAHYGDGVDPVVAARWATEWPEDEYWWTFWRGF